MNKLIRIEIKFTYEQEDGEEFFNSTDAPVSYFKDEDIKHLKKLCIEE